MVFQPGNQDAKKLDTPSLMIYAFNSYCAHLARGKSKMSWNLKTPVKLTWQTMEKYIKENPDVLKSIDKDIAWSDGFAVWEEVVEESAIGKNKEANTASLQMLMRNKYGWDKKDKEQEEGDTSTLDATQRVLDQLSKLQNKDQPTAQ